MKSNFSSLAIKQSHNELIALTSTRCTFKIQDLHPGPANTRLCFRNSTPQKLLSFPHALATQIWKMQIKLYNKYERNILMWYSFRVYKSLHHNCNRIFMKYAEHVVQLRPSETLMSIKLRHSIVCFLSYQHYMSVSRTYEWRSFVCANTFFVLQIRSPLPTCLRIPTWQNGENKI